MRKTKIFLVISFAVFVTPSLAYAAWWNPLTWFQKPAVTEPISQSETTSLSAEAVLEITPERPPVSVPAVETTKVKWWNPASWFRKPDSPPPTRLEVSTTTVEVSAPPAVAAPSMKNEAAAAKQGVSLSAKVVDQSAEIERLRKEIAELEEKQTASQVVTKQPVPVTQSQPSNFNRTPQPKVVSTLTNEQEAIKMATDVEYPNSSLDKETRQEIGQNWDAVLKFYTGKRGKGTTEDMYKDILDAYYKWHKDLLERDPVARARFCASISSTLDFNSCMESALPLEDRFKIIVERARIQESSSPRQTYPVYIPAPSSKSSAFSDYLSETEKIKQDDFNRSVCDKAGGNYSLDRCW